MSAKPKRIFTRMAEGGGTYRILHRIERNEHGDIVLTLENGEAWHFTPRDSETKTPCMDAVNCLHLSMGRKWFPNNDAIVLINPEEQIIAGCFRIVPPPAGGQAEAIIETVKTEHAATRRAMPKAAKYGFNLAMNVRDKGAKKVGGQRKVTPQQMKTALRKVDALLDSGEATSAAVACRAVHTEMVLPIALGRFQNIYSNPKEKEAVRYKKTSKSPKASRK